MKNELYTQFWAFAKARLRLMQDGATTDPILQAHRFTNCYRACDRVSQYLIKEVIQAPGEWSKEDVLLRTILFRLFNRIDTWVYLNEEISELEGSVSWDTWHQPATEKLLDLRSNAGYPVFTGVYRITSKNCYGRGTKHGNYLACVTDIMLRADELFEAECLKEIYESLLSTPLIGPFLAMQLATDLGYTDMFPWTENDFIHPGPGSRRGVSKTFGIGFGEAPAIIDKLHEVAADQKEYGFPGLELKNSMTGASNRRSLSLMDVQNLFCEYDKYLRVARPEVAVTDFGLRRVAKRPKQQYSPARDDDGNLRVPMTWPDSYTFPRKWYA